MDFTDERGGIPSASAGERIYHCPGSPALCKTVPESDSTEVSLAGDRIHEAMCTGSFGDLAEDELDIYWGLSTETGDAAAQWSRENGLTDAGEVRKEWRCWMRNDTLQPIGTAKLDYALIHPEKALVIDYKTGFLNPTHARSNIQLRIQAMCLDHETDKTLKHIRVAILRYRFGGTFVAADYTRKDLEMAEKEYQFMMWRAEQVNAVRVPGPWCNYCPAKAHCPEGMGFSLMPVGAVGKGLQIDKQDVDEILPQLTNQQLAYIYERKSVIEKIIYAAEDRMKGLSEQELQDLGFWRKPGARPRAISDIMEAHRILVGGGLLTPEQFTEACTVPVGKLENMAVAKMVEEGRAKTQKEAAVNFNRMMEGSAMTRKQNASSLKRLGEK